MFINVEMDGMKFSEKFLQEEFVATTPGNAFGRDYSNWVRLSYATSRENIEEFIRRFERFIQ
jgi:aspartate/methionine/tyrosine aminotransferase